PHLGHLFISCLTARQDLHSFPTRRSSDLTRMYFNMCLAYTGREEITNAINEVRECVSKGILHVGDINAESLASAMYSRGMPEPEDRKSTRLNSSHVSISYAVFCLKKKIPD